MPSLQDLVPGLREGYTVPLKNLEGAGVLSFGNIWYVNSSTGSDTANNGKAPNQAFATLSAASSAATASNGDIIYIAPGHTETLTSATSLTLSKAGITVIGLGSGSLRPTFTLGTVATTTINVTAANITISNIIVVANFADIASAWTLTTAQEFTLQDVEHRDTSSVLNFLNIIDTNTTTNDARGLTLRRVKRLGAGATTATTVIKMDGTNDRLIVEDCYFAHANVDDGGLFMIIATGKVVTNMEVKNSRFNLVGVSSATAGVLVTTNGSTNSGYFYNCFVKHLDATSEIMVTASSGFVFWNLYATAVADKQGYLVPAADS